MDKHKLNKHSIKEEREIEFKYYCKMCDYDKCLSISYLHL